MDSVTFGQIVSGQASFRILKNALKSAENIAIVIASAYTKLSTLVEVGGLISGSNRVRILTRWQPRDLVCGSSDLDCYVYARDRGWPFYIRQDFHGKVYFVDEAITLIGSANLTGAGSGGGRIANEETMVPIESNHGNASKINQLFDSATQVTDRLHQTIEDCIRDQSSLINEGVANVLLWPQNITDALTPSIPSSLLVADTFWSDATWLEAPVMSETDLRMNESIAHDASLLGFTSAEQLWRLNPRQLEEVVTRSKPYRWLLMQLNQAVEHQLFFGELTALLHDALIDDPRPYRRDVKALLANLLAWIRIARLSSIQIDSPNYSQRIRRTP